MRGPSAGRAPSDPALVGRVVRPHALAGELVVELLDPTSTVCAAGSEIWLAGAWRRVVRCRGDNKGRRVISVEGVADRDGAEALRDEQISIEAEQLPELDETSFYVHDLVGCRVADAGGGDLGRVVAVVPGPQDLLEIERGGERSLVPLVQDLLLEIDVEGRRIVIDAPAGLDEATRG